MRVRFWRTAEDRCQRSEDSEEIYRSRRSYESFGGFFVWSGVLGRMKDEG
jgi:hypothetical protein